MNAAVPRPAPPAPPFVVAIDGPAAAGKGTLARRLAATLDLPYLDTGLLYRAVARQLLLAHADPADAAAATRAAAALLAADLQRPDLRTPDLRTPDLRTPDADRAASQVAAHPGVRAALLAFQRRFAAARGAVLDGRDIGTVIFPAAPAKLFVTASPEARARRRWLERTARGEPVSLAEIAADMAARDARDAARAAAPLRPAADALVLDTTDLDPDAAYALALGAVRAARGA